MHNYITKGIALAVAIAASGMVQADEKKNHDPYFSGIKIFAQKESTGSEWDACEAETSGDKHRAHLKRVTRISVLRGGGASTGRGMHWPVIGQPYASFLLRYP